MKGVILDFSIQTNSGIISGEDQKRYTFVGNEWKELVNPQRGMQIDFDLSDTGQAIGVYKAVTSSSSNQLTDVFSPPKDKTEEQYNPLDWYQKCIKNYVNFKGRARRKEFWFFQMTSTILILLIALILGTDSFAINLFALLLILPSLAVSARRLHDIGKSGWWYLISFTGIGIILLIIWWAKEGDTINNQYGEPAK